MCLGGSVVLDVRSSLLFLFLWSDCIADCILIVNWVVLFVRGMVIMIVYSARYIEAIVLSISCRTKRSDWGKCSIEQCWSAIDFVGVGFFSNFSNIFLFAFATCATSTLFL